MQTSGAMRRENANVIFSLVIVRKGGRPSIQRCMIEPRSRGVLDPPPARDDGRADRGNDELVL